MLHSRRYGGHGSWLTSLLEASVTARPKGNLLLRKLLPGSFRSLLGRGHNVEEGPGEADVSRNQRPGCATGKTSWQRDHHTPPPPAISDAAGVRWGTDEKTESSVQKWTGYMQAEAGLPKHDTRPGRRGGVEEGWLVSAQLFFRPQPPPRPPPAQH